MFGAPRSSNLLLLSAVLAFGAWSCAHALYSATSPVVSLDASNFKREIKSKGSALVEFYAPWYVCASTLLVHASGPCSDASHTSYTLHDMCAATPLMHGA